MSAECGTCGMDLVYGTSEEDGLGYCIVCRLKARVAELEEQHEKDYQAYLDATFERDRHRTALEEAEKHIEELGEENSRFLQQGDNVLADLNKAKVRIAKLENEFAVMMNNEIKLHNEIAALKLEVSVTYNLITGKERKSNGHSL